MRETHCGFNSDGGVDGSVLLANYGPTGNVALSL